MAFTSDDFLRFGLKWVGFSNGTIERTCDETNLSRFRDHYYADPSTIAKIYVDIGGEEDGLPPKYLLFHRIS